MSTTLDDLKSNDSDRIWSAGWKVVKTWDKELLNEVTRNEAALQKIFAEMKSIGHVGGDRDALENALSKISFYKSEPSCLCEFYSKNLRFNPEAEQAAGHVKISRDQTAETPNLVCECTTCHKTYHVTESEYHFTIWKWTLAA